MELRDYWRILRAHWVAVIAITLAGVAVAAGWTLIQPKVYTANASGILSVGTNSDIGSALSSESYAKSRVKSYLDVAKSRTVAELAAADIGIDTPADKLLKNITVTNPLDTATLKVSASAGSPQEAHDLAEAWIGAIGTQVEALENAGASAGERSIVQFRSLDAAQLPTEPSSPNRKLALAIGFLAGLAVAIGYALLKNIFDRRIRSVDEVERETGLSVLGTIPFHDSFNAEHRLVTSSGGNDRSENSAKEYMIAESLRDLRTNLQFMDIDNPPRVIVVTSALPGEGKSTVTANLAQTIATSGQRVIVIDGDLRRPTLAKAFGLLPGIGLTDLLIGRAQLADVLQPWGDTGLLYVLGAGKIPPNPSELLGSNALHRILDELSQHAIVIIDAPPLLPVTDAAILSARTDGALVVGYARRTTYDALKAALANLERVNGRALGIILNGVPQKGISAEGYGYRYRSYSYYGRRDDGETRLPKASDVNLQSASELFDASGDGEQPIRRRSASR